MKKRIHAILSIVGALLAVGASHENLPRVVDLRGQVVDLDSAFPDVPVLVVCYNRYNCRDCFVSLGEAIERVTRADTSLRVVVVARGGLSAMSRRSLNKEVRVLLPNVANVYFDCVEVPEEDPWPPLNVQGGIFGAFAIGRTPALLYRGVESRKVVVARNDLLSMPERDSNRHEEAEIEFLQRRIEAMADK